MSKFGKVTECKTNIEKSTAIPLYKKKLNEIKKAIPFKIVSKNQVFVGKFNKINASLIHGKPQNITERN